MIAQMVIDTAKVVSVVKPVAIGGLSLGFFWTILWPILKEWFEKLPKTNSTPVNSEPSPPVKGSDKPAPEGFVEHLKVIQAAAPNGNPEAWWGYALQGLTEADTMRAEVKLARRVGDSSPTVESPKEVVIEASPEKEVK